jgi:hypothetical protein
VLINSSIKVKSGKIKERQRKKNRKEIIFITKFISFQITKISIPLGMHRSVEKVQSIVLHSVGMHPIFPTEIVIING